MRLGRVEVRAARRDDAALVGEGVQTRFVIGRRRRMDDLDAISAELVDLFEMLRLAQPVRMCDDADAARAMDEIDDVTRRQALQLDKTFLAIREILVEC